MSEWVRSWCIHAMSLPLAYFLTFSCYGHWLHGDERGSVDREHNLPGTPWVGPQRGYRRVSREAMTEPPYALDAPRRELVLGAIREVCEYRAWRLWAAHVRSTHVHIVLSAHDCAPEKVMSDLKAYASRALKRLDRLGSRERRWTRHGSTRYLNDEAEVARAVRYVLFEQGAPQAVWDGYEISNAPDEPAP